MDTLVDFAKLVREAFGIESSATFIASFAICFAILGSIGGGILGYVVDKRYLKTQAAPETIGPGGAGGSAKVVGKRSGAEGGSGGQGGIGPGGPGGNAEVIGDDSFARGGDGGNAAQADGRGGPRTLGPIERQNGPTSMWTYGHGGHGADAPEYDRRIKILAQIRREYVQAFPDDAKYIDAGVDQVPIRWVNKRLEEMNEEWRVNAGDSGYVLPPLNKK